MPKMVNRFWCITAEIQEISILSTDGGDDWIGGFDPSWCRRIEPLFSLFFSAPVVVPPRFVVAARRLIAGADLSHFWDDFMKIYQSLVATTLLVCGLVATPAIAQAAAPAESSVKLQKTVSIADDADAMIQRSQADRVLEAPGFEGLQREFEALIRPAAAPTTRVAPVVGRDFPIPVENFVYQQGGVGLANGAVNHKYFGSCFKASYGVLGGSSDRVLPAPVMSTADSGVSPYLTPDDIHRLQALQFKFRYAFTGSYGSSLRVYLVNLTNQKTQFVGSLPPTSHLRPRCATVMEDLTPYIKEPGVYGVRFVMVNRGFKPHPYPLPYITPLKAGEMPGDVIDLGPDAPMAIESGKIKFPPIQPIFPRAKAVAGFDQVVVTVQRR
jgi:hypothetical protein